MDCSSCPVHELKDRVVHFLRCIHVTCVVGERIRKKNISFNAKSQLVLSLCERERERERERGRERENKGEATE